jgi:hypothetical protein
MFMRLSFTLYDDQGVCRRKSRRLPHVCLPIGQTVQNGDERGPFVAFGTIGGPTLTR